MAKKNITGAEVVRRMKAGDLPHFGGGYNDTAYFDDGTRVPHAVMFRLYKSGKVERPEGTSVKNRWTLTKAAQ